MAAQRGQGEATRVGIARSDARSVAVVGGERLLRTLAQGGDRLAEPREERGGGRQPLAGLPGEVPGELAVEGVEQLARRADALRAEAGVEAGDDALARLVAD